MHFVVLREQHSCLYFGLESLEPSGIGVGLLVRHVMAAWQQTLAFDSQRLRYPSTLA
jgi:hypothetical protein